MHEVIIYLISNVKFILFFFIDSLYIFRQNFFAEVWLNSIERERGKKMYTNKDRKWKKLLFIRIWEKKWKTK